MVLVAAGPFFEHFLRDSYRDHRRDVLKTFNQANMQVNPTKTVVVCKSTRAKQKLWKVWRAGRLPPVRLTTRDLGVDTQ
eukprot:159713-Amphidinium_carterae.2